MSREKRILLLGAVAVVAATVAISAALDIPLPSVMELLKKVSRSFIQSQSDPAQPWANSDRLMADVSMFFLSGVGAFGFALLAWAAVTRHASSAAIASKEIERLRLIRELEMDARELFCSPAFWTEVPVDADGNPIGGYFALEFASEHRWSQLELAMSEAYPWTAEKRHDHLSENGRRFARLTSQGGEQKRPKPGGARIEQESSVLPSSVNGGDREGHWCAAFATSDALHELIFWCKRVERSLDHGLLQDKDLHAFWRRILPLCTDLRFSFLVTYFSPPLHKDRTIGLKEVAAVKNLAGVIIGYCIENELKAPLLYLRGRIDKELECNLEPRVTRAPFYVEHVAGIDNNG